ncbi:E3 ubiquitin-protein ligase RNF183 isoform X1 [Erpetoichthys calabaricus]|uniref:E3 ubiquitin-protein ligase RNF183 isoform X1 n=1 Tax=Erpetoichthys calabaricus TaxID=27687 RepID=UPI002234CBE1|nr:E3 ubiquitin-protein ligase RNF183 isoform X1 [Erpetoichthys calabaricus]
MHSAEELPGCIMTTPEKQQEEEEEVEYGRGNEEENCGTPVEELTFKELSCMDSQVEELSSKELSCMDAQVEELSSKELSCTDDEKYANKPVDGNTESMYDTSDTECVICFCSYDNVFKAPKVLTCNHTFCLECLARINVSHEKGTTLVCPVCRLETQLPGANGLPTLQNNQEIFRQLPPDMQDAMSVRFNRKKGRLWVKRKVDPASFIKPVKVNSVSLSLDVGRPPSQVRSRTMRVLRSNWCYCLAIFIFSLVAVMLVFAGIYIFVVMPGFTGSSGNENNNNSTAWTPHKNNSRSCGNIDCN